ncbi:hypothetical protein GJW-30_1_04441 [Variibacter gotjawalensis]|uniref:Uncharacterized protein n=1 Tax=Variibacter gotjawalensis TaxID=1333996 RepID=A0A0S3Q108_9BRAD|nr:hypothetical protein [Variibacter gotjawalensis]NIK47725.1 hypothetical protein [Variibacter gotjawalensis]RZS49615.1 hypothetical protein EV661_2052 [Variibacter gotjawalensis]BAT61879.1 hypothetical protein GJW-30_1_04441 [Variibacter gotjawalensis]
MDFRFLFDDLVSEPPDEQPLGEIVNYAQWRLVHGYPPIRAEAWVLRFGKLKSDEMSNKSKAAEKRPVTIADSTALSGQNKPAKDQDNPEDKAVRVEELNSQNDK